MEQKEKEFLLKDLCKRLPYGVKCDIGDNNKPYTLCRIEIDNENGHLLDFTEDKDEFDVQFYLSEVKPYLFPISSITEEQLLNNGLSNVKLVEEYEGKFYLKLHHFEFEDYQKLFDFFHKYHIDYLGLIDNDYAIDATKLGIYN